MKRELISDPGGVKGAGREGRNPLDEPSSDSKKDDVIGIPGLTL